MRLEWIKLSHWRNISHLEFEPKEDLNFIVGENAQGKSSLLEAIYFLSFLESFRSTKNFHLIQALQPRSVIQAKISYAGASGEYVQSTLATSLDLGSNERTSVVGQVQGKTIRSRTEYLKLKLKSYPSVFHSIVFNPENHELVRGNPSERRNFLNRVIAAENVTYLEELRRYQRALLQRNAILSEGQSHSHDPKLQPFTQELIRSGSVVVFLRLKWLVRAAEKLPFHLLAFAQEQASTTLGYSGPLIDALHDANGLHFPLQGELPSIEEIRLAYDRALKERERAEWIRGVTLVGPHRDDLLFFLGGEPLGGVGSQGEIRSFLLALKLTELELYQNATSQRPILLLDDLSSELDGLRRKRLIEVLIQGNLQTFVTSTDRPEQVKRWWKVSTGNVTAEYVRYSQSSEEHELHSR